MIRTPQFLVIVLAATNVFAQHAGGSRNPAAHGIARPNLRQRMLRGGTYPIRTQGIANPRFGGPIYGDYFPLGPSLAGDAYDFGYDGSDYPLPPTMMVGRPSPVSVGTAPSPIRSVIHEYHAEAPAPGGTEQPAFTIALNDGSRLAATAVWVQNESVHYVDLDDRSHETPLRMVDRNLTRKLNDERHLNLRLPPAE